MMLSLENEPANLKPPLATIRIACKAKKPRTRRRSTFIVVRLCPAFTSVHDTFSSMSGLRRRQLLPNANQPKSSQDAPLTHS